MFTRDIRYTCNNKTLPSLHTKADELEKVVNTTIQEFHTVPLHIRRTLVNDESKISSNITMDIHMYTGNGNMVTKTKILVI